MSNYDCLTCINTTMRKRFMRCKKIVSVEMTFTQISCCVSWRWKCYWGFEYIAEGPGTKTSGLFTWEGGVEGEVPTCHWRQSLTFMRYYFLRYYSLRYYAGDIMLMIFLQWISHCDAAHCLHVVHKCTVHMYTSICRSVSALMIAL